MACFPWVSFVAGSLSPPPLPNPAFRALGAVVGPGLGAERQAGQAQVARGLAEERWPSRWPWAPAAGARGGVPSARHPFGTWRHCESFLSCFLFCMKGTRLGSPSAQYSGTSSLALCPGGQMHPRRPGERPPDLRLGTAAGSLPTPSPAPAAGTSSCPEWSRPGRPTRDSLCVCSVVSNSLRPYGL